MSRQLGTRLTKENTNSLKLDLFFSENAVGRYYNVILKRIYYILIKNMVHYSLLIQADKICKKKIL